MLASKKESFDGLPIRAHLLKARESHALVAPWEQEEDPENYISSQFINFLDSKMKNPEILKKSSTLLESSTIPDIESYTQNLTRSAITDESPMQHKLISRQLIAEKALDKGKDMSMSVTMSFSKKKSDLEEISLDGSGIMQKQPSLKKEASLSTSSGSLGLGPQINARPKVEHFTKKSVDYKPKSMTLKRPSTGVSYNRESTIKSPESSQYRGSLLKVGTFFDMAGAEGSAEKEVKEREGIEHEHQGMERIKSARKEKYRSSKTISDSKAFLSLDKDTKDITEAIARKSDFKPYSKSPEPVDSQILNEGMQGTFNSFENDKHSLAYLLSANMPDNNDKTTEVRPKSLKIARNIKTSGMRSRRSGVFTNTGVNSAISMGHKARENQSMTIQSLQPPSLLLSSNVFEERLTPVKKSAISINGSAFSPQRSTNLRYSISEDRDLPVGVQPFVENRSSVFLKQMDPNNNQKEEKEEEKVDIQDSIRFSNKVWSTHKDHFSDASVPQPKTFKKYEGEKYHRREPSSERIVNLNAQAEKFQLTVAVRPNRPETAYNHKIGTVSPQKIEGVTSFEKAKRYFMNKTFRVKENSVLQKSLERIRMKATLDVSKSMKIHNMSNLNKTEDEQDIQNRNGIGQEKLKNLLGSPANAIFIAGAPSGSVSANYQTAKEISIQTSDQIRQVKRPRLKRNI